MALLDGMTLSITIFARIFVPSNENWLQYPDASNASMRTVCPIGTTISESYVYPDVGAFTTSANESAVR